MSNNELKKKSSANEIFDETKEYLVLAENAVDFFADIMDKIHIPAHFREISVIRSEMSVRLENVLRSLNIKVFGDLHRKSFGEIERTRNCGQKTIDELRDIITAIQQEGFNGEAIQDFELKTIFGSINEKIFVPESIEKVSIDYFQFSHRLKNILSNLNVITLNDFKYFTLNEIKQTENCGQKTFDELCQLIERFQNVGFVEKLKTEYQDYLAILNSKLARLKLIEAVEEPVSEEPPELYKKKDGKIFIPASVGKIEVNKFNTSSKLDKIFESFGIVEIKNFENYSFEEIKKSKRYSKKTNAELKDFIVRVQRSADEEELCELLAQTLPKEVDLNGLIDYINNFLAETNEREREILLNRFGGTADEKIFTLEEIGEKFNVTRERIRQIESINIKKLKEQSSGISDNALNKLNDDCAASVSPLTARFLIHLTDNQFSLFQYPPNFYTRLLRELSPSVPVLTNNRVVPAQLSKIAFKLAQNIKTLLDEETEFMFLSEVFNRLYLQNASDDFTLNDFFEAVQANFFILQPGDSPDVLLIATNKNQLSMKEVARQILSKSERALKPEEIIERAAEIYGTEIDLPTEGRLINLPFYERDFYLLDSRTIGLRQHFRLPEEKWKEVQDDFYHLLKRENRPVSTSEVIAGNLFQWGIQTTASEATEILREDERFKDLGRFLFALVEWQIEEREPIKELMIKIFQEIGHPLTTTELGKLIQKRRSAFTAALSNQLRQHEAVREYICGYYGLKEWSDDFNDFFINTDKFIYRLIGRSKKTFAELCENFGTDGEGETADKLWRKLRTMSDLRFSSAHKSPETKINRAYR